MARLGKNINKKEERIKQEMLLNRKPVVEKCKGKECEGKKGDDCKEITNNLCNCYIDPSFLWRFSPCPRASHLYVDLDKKSSEKVRVGQQKQIKKFKK